MPMTDSQAIYESLTAAAAEFKADRSAVSALAAALLRAYDAGWETGDVYEALTEGGLDLSFRAIESLAQRMALL